MVSRDEGWKITAAHAGQIDRSREGMQERIVLNLGEDGLRMDWARVRNFNGNRQAGRIRWSAATENTIGLLGAVERCFT